MSLVVSIDPGKNKCGLVCDDINQKKVYIISSTKNLSQISK